VRPNGLILATRGDAPEIWQIDPATGQGALLVSVTGAFNLTGIAEVTPPHKHPKHPHQSNCAAANSETYVFGSAHIPTPLQVEPGSAKVWTLQFPTTPGTTTGDTPTVSLLAAMPNAGFINGITAWSRGRVLLSDTEAEAVYLMDVATGSYTTPLTGLAGINGIKATTKPGYVYRADHASQTLSRIPVDDDAVATGPAEVLAAEQAVDDFAIAVGGDGAGKAYVGAMFENQVVEVVFGAAPSSGPGVKRLVAENLSGTGTGLVTVVAFGRRAEDAELLYAAVGQGGGSASIVRLDPSE
jgi:sugar lactone lactonase YvrE